MPNHITNSITLSGNKEKIAEMMENIKNDEVGVGSIDFNKIIPMPESLNIQSGSATERGYKAYKDFMEVYTLFGTTNMDNILHVPLSSEEVFLRQRSDIERAEFELGKTAFQNMVKYGATTWYDWCIQNWGTKWNSYGYDPEVDYNDGDSLWFQTAWSAPHPILEKLSEMYPSITFAHQWADEDLGANCGSRTYLGGEMIDEFIPEGVRAMQFALELWDYDPVDLGLALNKTGTGYVSMTEDKYELIELFGKPALFTNDRLTDADIPEGLYCYHLRESDDGDCFCSIEPKVVVNHGGSIITNEPIDFGKAGYIGFTDDTSPNFIGNDLTLEEYMLGNFNLDQIQEEQSL